MLNEGAGRMGEGWKEGGGWMEERVRMDERNVEDG